MSNLKDKIWEVLDPGNNWQPVYTYYTYDKIILEYFPYWSNAMREVGREDLISKDRCVEDWVVVNFAREILR